MSEIKNVAVSYAVERGWSVFPVHGIDDAGNCTCGKTDCKSPGKHPTTPNGLKAATKDERGIALMFKQGNNIAVVTGEPSGIWVLDVDGQAGEASLAALESEYGQLPATLVHYTGNGRHLIFKWPGYPIRNSVRRLGEKLDVRGDGGYIVAAPSKHASGTQYRFADATAAIAEAPDWLLELVKKEPETAEPARYDIPSAYADRDLTADQVKEMLSFIHPDAPYQDWVEIGMGLHAGGWPVQMWDDWSRGGAKYQNGDCYKRWRGFKGGGGISFGTVWHYATQAGWTPGLLDSSLNDGPNPAAPFLKKIREPKLPESVKVALPETDKALPFNPLDLTGAIGDTVRWICESAIKPQPELALLNTLAAMGAVFGRRYATEWDTRTNVYIVGLAETGSGKDHSRKQIKKLMVAAGLHDFLAGDSIVSGPGLLRGVEHHPAQVLHLDEFGMLLKAITEERGPVHMKIAAKILTELYTSSGSVFHGGNYASPDIKPVIIDHPNLCIYGTSTREKYVEALSRSAIASGELNRFLVIETVEPQRRRDPASHEPSERLVSQWAAYKSQAAEGQGNLQAVGGANIAAPKPITVRWAAVLDRIHDMGDSEDELRMEFKPAGMAGVWSRYREQVIKIAMICAIARNPILPTIEPGDLDFAEAIVQTSCRFIVRLAKEHIADSAQEKDVNAILDILRAANGEWVSRTTIAKRLRGLRAQTRNDILADLVNVQGTVEINQENTSKGRPSVFYRYIGD